MNLLKDNVKKIYFRYLLAAFGSSLISTIYGFVDTIVIGKYEGPIGSSAMAVIAPIWNIIFSLGLLLGIGGSVYFSNIKANVNKTEDENEYFTIAILGAILLSILCIFVFITFEDQILYLFGANSEILPLCKEYLLPVKFVIPTYIFTQILASFLRNDNDPALATKAVLFGGIFNVFGDIYFVFGLKLGMFGAGLATAIGNTISLLTMCAHFFSNMNSLHIVKVNHMFTKAKNIITTGFSSFFVDVAMGIVTALINNQIMKYMNSNALAVYSIIVNISTCVQCCGYSVGQASQPIISASLGAKQYNRIHETLKYATIASFGFSLVWVVLTMLFPTQIVSLLMKATEEVLQITPHIIRLYSLSFILLPFNVFTTYYFQSIMKPSIAFGISLARGAIISGILIMILPAIIGETGIWVAMPITELVVFFIAIYNIKKTYNLSN